MLLVGATAILAGAAALLASDAGSARPVPLDAFGTLIDGLKRLRPVGAYLEHERAGRRRHACLVQLPTLLDVLTLGLSAGLSFDASLELYCTRYNDDLAEALGEAMVSWRIGLLSRSEALSALAKRLDVAALQRFASTVSEALAFGSPLAEVLEHQAQAIRDEHRSHIEEEIEKVPVKMLIPLGTLIVPAMLLAILGPLMGPALRTV